MGCHFLLQGIFLTQGSNPSLLTSPALAGGFCTTEPPGKHWGPITQSVIYLLLLSFGDLFLESSVVRLFNAACASGYVGIWWAVFSLETGVVQA